MKKLIIILLFALPFSLFGQNQEPKAFPDLFQVRPEPLYVLDGKILGKGDLKKDSSQVILSINNLVKPSEIESITVLKDAEAIKNYGDAGKKGVVIITTIYSERSKKR